MNIASADNEGNSNEIVNTWSNDAYSDIWERAWGKSLPYKPKKKKKKKDDSESEDEDYEEEEETTESPDNDEEDLYEAKEQSICTSFIDENGDMRYDDER